MKFYFQEKNSVICMICGKLKEIKIKFQISNLYISNNLTKDFLNYVATKRQKHNTADLVLFCQQYQNMFLLLTFFSQNEHYHYIFLFLIILHMHINLKIKEKKRKEKKGKEKKRKEKREKKTR